jgi:hypothetical protein
VAKENLTSAKKAPQDEFYTLYEDIEKEVNAYLDYDPDAFRDKVVLLPCDDPEWSNFTKYFSQNFSKLGLKKLISTSFAPDSKMMQMLKQPTLFEMESPQFDSSKTNLKGKIFTLKEDSNKDSRIDFKDIEWQYLEGDGDFRSAEIKRLRDEADIIVTNPPFSLFRDFLTWINEGKKNFLLIGNMNAITYKEVYPLIQENKLWLGATNFNTGMYFKVPDDFIYSATYKFERERDGVKVNRVPSVCWFTNIEHGKRHQPLPLMTTADNLKFSRYKEIKSKSEYARYVNCDAIDVPFTQAIPSDYDGVMGVPISFLDKYSPEQFEIVNFRHGDDGKDLRLEDGTNPYFRILIRHKRPVK